MVNHTVHNKFDKTIWLKIYSTNSEVNVLWLSSVVTAKWYRRPHVNYP